MKLLRLFCFAFIFLYNPISKAEIYFNPALFYKSGTQTNNGVETEFSETYYDIRLGWGGPSGLYLGAIYSAMINETNSTELTRTSYGVSVGYIKEWFIIGHYFLDSEYETSTNFKYVDGKGFQVDLGYLFKAFSQVSIGPQLTYRNIAYDSAESGAAKVEADFEATDFMPYISVAVIF